MTQNDIKARYEGVQSFLTDGCLFLSLMSIAEQYDGEKQDLLAVLQYAKTMGYINALNEMTVAGQEMLLRDLTGKQWRREVRQSLPEVVPDEMWTVEKWVSAKTGFTHFKRRFVDTLTASQTVASGVLTEYYCYIVG